MPSVSIPLDISSLGCLPFPSDNLLGVGSKDVLIGTQEFLNVLPRGHVHGPILFSNKIATQLEGDGAISLSLN